MQSNSFINKYKAPIKEALYFIVHNYYTTNNKNRCCDETFGSDTCNSSIHELERNRNNDNYVIISYYDSNGRELEGYLEINRDDETLWETAKKYLDPDAQFIVVGVTIGYHMKVGRAIYFDIALGTIIKTIFISAYRRDSSHKENVLLYIQGLKRMNEEYYKKYDLSKITGKNITINESGKLSRICNII
jgi:hypothetical protein